jgi:HEPN domain-containing protein
VTTEQLASEWLGYARDDFRSAEFLTQLRPQPREIICFHCQQSARIVLAFATGRIEG